MNDDLTLKQIWSIKKELIEKYGVDKLNEGVKKLEKDISNN